MHLFGLINTTNDFPFVCYNSYFEEVRFGTFLFFFIVSIAVRRAEISTREPVL